MLIVEYYEKLDWAAVLLAGCVVAEYPDTEIRLERKDSVALYGECRYEVGTDNIGRITARDTKHARSSLSKPLGHIASNNLVYLNRYKKYLAYVDQRAAHTLRCDIIDTHVHAVLSALLRPWDDLSENAPTPAEILLLPIKYEWFGEYINETDHDRLQDILRKLAKAIGHTLRLVIQGITEEWVYAQYVARQLERQPGQVGFLEEYCPAMEKLVLGNPLWRTRYKLVYNTPGDGMTRLLFMGWLDEKEAADSDGAYLFGIKIRNRFPSVHRDALGVLCGTWMEPKDGPKFPYCSCSVPATSTAVEDIKKDIEQNS